VVEPEFQASKFNLRVTTGAAGNWSYWSYDKTNSSYLKSWSSNDYSKPINYILDQVWIDQKVDGDPYWDKNQEPISHGKIPAHIFSASSSIEKRGAPGLIISGHD